ncbi:sensor histidine kinase [Anaerocolumna sp. MB42-C2]|uniref:sensor histidine kinase n=1 Tax=Anaerocolumna sp. MB42-C2 TaxID=3070997 RepID=UPI0027E07B9A|nr:histidine kinase [Anaerocolumna sp. MB42-C2]WMJ89715.1 histidine kinase [Anaerocolumna sp. MB42-C2]
MSKNKIVKLMIRNSLSAKVSLINAFIILMGFIIMIFVTAKINYNLSVAKEKQMMDVYLSNSLSSVDNKLKDMGRVSLMCFSDTHTQDILKNYESFTYMEKLSSSTYLNKLYTSLVTIRDDISGIYMFDFNNLIFYQDSYDPSFRRNYEISNYIKKLEIIEQNDENVAGCKLVLGKQPEFMRYSKSSVKNKLDKNCLYLIRGIKSFSPNKQIGHILLTTPARVMDDILKVYLSPETPYLLITEDGSIVCSDEEDMIGSKLKEEMPQVYRNITSKSGSFRATIHNGSYLFSYQKSEYSKLILITGTENKLLSLQSMEFIKLSLVFFALMILTAVVLVTYYTRKMLQPLHKLSQAMANFNQNDMCVRFPIESDDETGQLVASFNTMMDIINNLIESEYKSKVSLREAQLNQQKMSLLYLKNQINSHFLYNTLDNIRTKAEIQGDKDVAYMIMLLVDFFRLSVKVDSQLVYIQHEVKLLQVYFKLICLRYPNLLCDLDVDTTLDFVKIPNFILQPLAENSLMHGLKGKGYKGRILVSIQQDYTRDGYIIIKVYDNGVGLREENRYCFNKMLAAVGKGILDDNNGEDNHIGILNVQRRLLMYYPEEKGLIYTENPEGGITVTIILKKEIEINRE